MKKGLLICIAGPSGVGKGTIVKELIANNKDFELSVSATTRAPRPGEVDGKDYYFVSNEQFDKLINDDDLLEWANVHTNRYGTPKSAVQKKLEAGINVILEIDVQGVKNVKNKLPEAITIFILPPSFNELKSRLEGRGTETPEKVKIRLENAYGEVEAGQSFEYSVINDKIENACDKILAIIQAEKSKTGMLKTTINQLMTEMKGAISL